MLSDKESKELYKQLKGGTSSKFREAYHCALIIRIMSDSVKGGTRAAFCIEAGISDRTFYSWLAQFPIFNDCYRYGCMLSQKDWEEQGRDAINNEEFRIEIWKTIGSARYGVGKTNRVRVHISPDSTPFDQYKQLMNQAAAGDFTAGELKQLMESINIGCRAYEQFILDQKVDAMEANIKKMENHSAERVTEIAKHKKTD